MKAESLLITFVALVVIYSLTWLAAYRALTTKTPEFYSSQFETHRHHDATAASPRREFIADQPRTPVWHHPSGVL
jgi:hypothetical protein